MARGLHTPRLRDVLESIQLLVVSLDLDGRITYCNPFLCEHTGWAREELLGQAWLERFPNGDPHFLDALRRGAIRVHDEYPMITRAGEPRDIRWSNTFDRDPDGRIIGSTSIGEDITERNRGARQEASLRRIAVMVAAEAPPEQVFHAVTEEVARLVGGQTANLVRFGAKPFTGVVVAAWSEPGVTSLPVGEEVTFDGPTAVMAVIQTGRPVRVDDYGGIEGTFADRLRDLGLRSSVSAPVDVDGRQWGAITVSTIGAATLPLAAEARVGQFTQLVALGISNAEARAQLAASRARIVAAGDAERRRLERNLHDGAQQRLVSLSLDLRMARSTVDPDSETARLLDTASAELAAALDELRELARGIHPAVLTDHGLRPAIAALTARSTVPVDTTIALDDEVDPQIEAAAYYVVAEAFTNVLKYAEAGAIDVRIARDGPGVLAQVVDDGVGGADAANGSGLRGLRDRVEALGGTLTVTSPAGGGTCVAAHLPPAPPPAAGPRADARPGWATPARTTGVGVQR